MIAQVWMDWVTLPARFWWWTRTHPRATIVILAIATIVFPILNASITHAADQPNKPPFYPSYGLTDGNGVFLTNYATLPFDRGGGAVTDGAKSVNGFLTDLLWGLYLWVCYMALWLIDQALTFSWVALIQQPFSLLSNLVGYVVRGTGWVPLALTVCAFVVTFFIVRGRWAAAFGEVFLCVACTVGLGLLTGGIGGSTGIITSTLSSTQNVASGAVTAIHNTYKDATTLDVVEPNLSGLSYDQKITIPNITGTLANLMIRQPAQVISFGHILEGDANTAWDAQFTKSPTKINQDIHDNKLWCSLGESGDTGCLREEKIARPDQDAYDWAHVGVTNLKPAGVALISSFANTGLVAFTVGFVFLIGWCLVWALYSLVVLIVRLAMGILPGVDRGRIVQAYVGTFLGVIMVGVLVVVAAFGIEFAAYLIRVFKLGTIAPFLITISLSVITIVLIRLKKQGTNAAQLLSRIGSNLGIRGHSGDTATSTGRRLLDKSKEVISAATGTGIAAAATAINPAVGAVAGGIVNRYKSKVQSSAATEEFHRQEYAAQEQERHIQVSERIADATEYTANQINPNLRPSGRHSRIPAETQQVSDEAWAVVVAQTQTDPQRETGEPIIPQRYQRRAQPV